MSENTFEKQKNYGFGMTFNLTGKIPEVNKRIFKTLTDLNNYVNDISDSAIEGLLLSVISDTSDNNGVYYVNKVKRQENETSSISKISTLENITDIDNAIRTDFENADNAIKKIIGDIDSDNNVINLINDVSGLTLSNLDLLNETKNIINNYTINGKVISSNPVLTSDNLTIENYYSKNSEAHYIIEGDIITTAIKKLDDKLMSMTLALTAAINDLEERIGYPSFIETKYYYWNESDSSYKELYSKPDDYKENNSILVENIPSEKHENENILYLTLNVEHKSTGLYKKYDDLLSQIKN